ncbi:glutamyl-tRNA(Gln) amidotransferase subunit A, mitochondrial-like [Oscarella lobularis]|uniref:glutamyl-tRNA(Gln) amidotransferase subunit A, mitochondrial-like n=1 Tax=Oscarella lobularis TaxID=121494 RepID=UPI003313C5DB
MRRLSPFVHRIRVSRQVRRSSRSSVCSLKLHEVLVEMNAGRLSSVEITQACIDQMRQNRHLNATISEISTEIALQQARSADARRKQGLPPRRLDGIPVIVKDNYAVEQMPMTCASNMLRDFAPSYTATVVRRWLDEGAILLGKANMDEFGTGNAGSRSFLGPSLNPWRRKDLPGEPVPGGSSGGSVAAVAANMCYGSLGSDTGGSVRLPASYCGIVGYQPSYGRASRFGLVPLASSLDCPSVFARSVQDAALLGDVMCGHDPLDATSVRGPRLDTLAAFASVDLDADYPLEGVRIGIPQELYVEELSDDGRRLWMKAADWLQDAGAEVVPVSLPSIPLAVACYETVCSGEAFSNMSKFSGLTFGGQPLVADASSTAFAHCREQLLGKHMRDRITFGSFVLSERGDDSGKFFTLAAKARRLIYDDFNKVLRKDKGVDVLLCLSSIGQAFYAGTDREKESSDGVSLMLTPTNLAGATGISIPCGLSSSDKLPIGLQVMGRRFGDEIIFRVSRVLEAKAGFTYFRSQELN